MIHRAAPTRRRAFVLPVVLLLILTASLAIGAMMERHNAQIRMVERQVEDYRTHHEQLGVQAIVSQWLRRASPNEIRDFAASDGPSYTFIIEDEIEIRVYLRDSQGLPLATASSAPGGQSQDTYRAMLERLREQERGHLSRRVGPFQISARAAPAPVLAALLPEDGTDFADAVIEAREQDRLDRQMVLELLERSDVQPQDAQTVANALTFEPVLWTVGVEAIDQRRTRRFGLLVELEQGNRLRVHEWLSEADLADSVRPAPADDEDDDQG